MSQDGGEADVESTLNPWRLVAIGKAEPPTGSLIGNAFPSDAVRDAYLSRIDQWPEEEVRAVLRNMLGHSRDLAVYDELQLAILKRSRGEAAAAGSVAAAAAVASTSDQAAIRPAFSEYERRLILAAAKKTSVPVWEGLTWVLDLLPYAPSEALSTVSAYITAHFGVLPDVRLNALFDAQAVIRGRYIGHAGTSVAEQVEVLLSLPWRDFEYMVSALYHRQGYETVVTPAVKDRGKDVIATRSDPPEVLYIQCKNWRGKIDVDVVAALLGRVEVDRVTRGVLVGTSGFTQGPASATELAADQPRLELLYEAKLVQMLNKHLGRDWPVRVDRIISSERRRQAADAAGIC